MSHGVFRYFVPGVAKEQLSPEVIAARGLADRLGDVITGQSLDEIRHAEMINCQPGPDGGRGVIIVPMPADGTAVQRGQYVPGRQEWVKSCRRDYWIGRDLDHPPTPEGLQRPEVVEGYDHTLGDGNVWLCPTIRRGLIWPAVPCSYSRMNGQLTRTPLPKYRDIFQRAADWSSHYVGGDGLPPDSQWEAAVECLSVNYRIADEEVSLLGLLTDQTMRLVIDAAIDLPWLEEAASGSDPEKKRLWDAVVSALESSTHGDEESCPAMPLPSPTSCSSDTGTARETQETAS